MENLSNLFYRSIKKRGEKKNISEISKILKRKFIQSRAARLIRFVIGNIGPDIPLQFVARAKKEKKEETRKFPIYIYVSKDTIRSRIRREEEKFKILLGKRIDNRQQLHQRVIISDRIYTYIYIYLGKWDRGKCANESPFAVRCIFHLSALAIKLSLRPSIPNRSD